MCTPFADPGFDDAGFGARFIPHEAKRCFSCLYPFARPIVPDDGYQIGCYVSKPISLTLLAATPYCLADLGDRGKYSGDRYPTSRFVVLKLG